MNPVRGNKTMKILTIDNKKEEKFLRQKTKEFDLKKYSKSELRKLIKEMRQIMKDANGVGLSANQVGLDRQCFIAQVPDENGRQKFYAIFNPKINSLSEENIDLEEGCLSVPNVWGIVPRSTKITIEGLDANGKKIKIKAWGFLAQVFQHEIGHLNGALFIDKAKELKKTEINPPASK